MNGWHPMHGGLIPSRPAEPSLDETQVQLLADAAFFYFLFGTVQFQRLGTGGEQELPALSFFVFHLFPQASPKMNAGENETSSVTICWCLSA